MGPKGISQPFEWAINLATAVSVRYFPRCILQCSVALGFMAFLSLLLLMTLTGCASNAPTGQWIPMYFNSDVEEPVTASDRFDMKLQHIETSPVPGATARVLPDPPGITRTGPTVSACVTDAGYCPLAAETAAGRNCLCQTTGLAYGGVTGLPPKYNTTTNPW